MTDAKAASHTELPSGAATAALETRFTWFGSPWSLAGPCLFNAAMMVVTVGIYSFWGRTELRRRMWSSVRLDGEPMVYHGTGLEMFKGFMAAAIIVLLPIFATSFGLVIIYGQGSTRWNAFQLALLILVYPVLKGLATYRARRYRLARTSWRGIRASVRGSAGEFAFLGWATTLLVPLTLGWIEPWRALYIQRFLTDDTMLGDRKLRMHASAKSLYLRYALFWVGSLVILTITLFALGKVIGPGIVAIKTPADWRRVLQHHWIPMVETVLAATFVWSLIGSFYYASLYNLAANSTVLLPPSADVGPVGDTAPPPTPAPLHFKLTTRGPALIWLFVTNQLLTYGSLFILRPVATARSLRYFTRHLSIVGAFDAASIQQNPNVAIAEGEGLAQAFDFDAF